MPGPHEGGGGSGGGSGGGGLHVGYEMGEVTPPVAGGSISQIGAVYSTASGTVTTASQIFSTSSKRRNCVMVTNTGGTNDLHVGFTSDVSATKHFARIAPGSSAILYVGPYVDLYLQSTTTTYTAHEVKVFLGR